MVAVVMAELLYLWSIGRAMDIVTSIEPCGGTGERQGSKLAIIVKKSKELGPVCTNSSVEGVLRMTPTSMIRERVQPS